MEAAYREHTVWVRVIVLIIPSPPFSTATEDEP